jgi:hypothetical protein
MSNAKLRFAISISANNPVTITVGNTATTQIGYAPIQPFSTLVALDDSDIVVAAVNANACRRAAKAFIKSRVPGLWDLGTNAENVGHKIRDGGWVQGASGTFGFSFPLLFYLVAGENYAELPTTITFGNATLRVRYFVVVQDS